MRRTHRILLVGGAVAVVAAGAAAPIAAWAADPTPAPATSQPDDRPGRGPEGGKGDLAKQLATALGLDESKVTAALDASRPTKPADGQKPTEADRTAGQDKLAAALGVTPEKLKAAMDAIRAEHRAADGTRLAERLKQAVTDGKLSQAEADAVVKAHGAGVLGGGGRGPR